MGDRISEGYDDEIILEISEYRTERDWERKDGPYYNEAGFKIVTTAQEILLLIDDSSSCCETWGYFLTEDDTEKFVGETLLGIEVVDTNRSTRYVFTSGYQEIKGENREPIDLDGGDTMFVDIKTTRGVLQFVTYNSHNGYYGHTARIVSAQLSEERTL